MYLIYSDKEVNRFLPWFPVKSMEETRKLFEERYMAQYTRPQAYAYAVCLKKDHIPVGYIHVDVEEPHDFGYDLRKEFWHQDIMTEAARAVTEQLKKDGIPYITATHDRNNPRSGGVMKRIGMEYQYSYEEQWQPKNIPVISRMYQLNFDGQENRVYKKYWNLYDEHFIETEI